MAFVQITDDICVFPGVGGYNLTASGSIIKGQGVTLVDDNTVGVPTTSDSRLFGIANATTAHGFKVCIYGPKNLVRCKFSGAQTAGTLVGVISEGYISNLATYAESSQAIVIEGTTSTGNGRILILG